MSFVETVGKFHISLDGFGLLLQGAGERPAYRIGNAPVYGTRFASGDRDYNDLSQWWYLIQTDWSGGIKNTLSFEDDAKFYYSSNIDARTKPGSIRLEKQLVLEYDNDAADAEIFGVFTPVQSGNDVPCFTDNGAVRTFGGVAIFDNDGTPTNVLGRGAYLWVFGSSVRNTAGTSNPRTTSDKSSQINGIIDGSIDECCGLIIANTLYVVGISTTSKLFIVKTTVADPASGADWTLVAEQDFGNDFGSHFVGAVAFGGEILTLVSCEPVSHFHSLDIGTGILTKVREFSGTQQVGIYYKGMRWIQNFQDRVLITIPTGGSDDEDGEIWSYNGSTLEKIFSRDDAKIAFSTREAKPWLNGGCVVMGDYAFWGNLVYDGTSFFNFIKGINDATNIVGIPVGTDGEFLYMVDNVVTGSDPQSQLYKYNPFGTTFKDGASNEAFIIFSQHDKLQSIDKLLHNITIGFEQFLSGQSIAVYYSTNPIPDPNITTGGWTLLGTASHTLDGGTVTSKTFQFPDGTTAKKIWFRVQLASGGTNTPTMSDFTLEYLPMPDYRFQWVMNINCADEVKRPDGRKMEQTAREIKARLMRAWQTKSALDFGDVDYAQTLLNDAALTASATTIVVDSAADFPEQGRIKIDDEEIYYTGRTQNSFTGCTRGARGTRAATHADNAVVHNGYRVLVMDVDVQLPTLLEDKNTEYIVGLTLREV